MSYHGCIVHITVSHGGRGRGYELMGEEAGGMSSRGKEQGV